MASVIPLTSFQIVYVQKDWTHFWDAVNTESLLHEPLLSDDEVKVTNDRLSRLNQDLRTINVGLALMVTGCAILAFASLHLFFIGAVGTVVAAKWRFSFAERKDILWRHAGANAIRQIRAHPQLLLSIPLWRWALDQDPLQRLCRKIALQPGESDGKEKSDRQAIVRYEPANSMGAYRHLCSTIEQMFRILLGSKDIATRAQAQLNLARAYIHHIQNPTLSSVIQSSTRSFSIELVKAALVAGADLKEAHELLSKLERDEFVAALSQPEQRFYNDSTRLTLSWNEMQTIAQIADKEEADKDGAKNPDFQAGINWYTKAFADVKPNFYNRAVFYFSRFLLQNPKSEDRAEAQYQLARIHYHHLKSSNTEYIKALLKAAQAKGHEAAQAQLVAMGDGEDGV